MTRIRVFISLLIILGFFSLKSLAQLNSGLENSKSIEDVKIYNKNNVWIFILVGQSNMAGRAKIEPQDTVTNERILTIDTNGLLMKAKEPLHFYEPSMMGLDCGLSFGNTLLKLVPDSVSILLVPAAIGGSSIDQWIGDSLHRGVKLLSNFKKRSAKSLKYGTLKAILWHQGESDANPTRAITYYQKLNDLFAQFRNELGSEQLPILTARIGLFNNPNKNQKLINNAIKLNADKDPFTFLIKSNDLSDKGDQLHFDAKSQRIMGERFARKYYYTIN